MKKLVAIATACLVFAGILIAAPQPANTTSDSQRQDAVNLVRLINTAEHSYKRGHGRYCTFDELVASGTFDKKPVSLMQKPTTLNLANANKPLVGFKLTFTVSSDGANYQVSVIRDQDKGWGAFSDDAGLIFEGKPLQ